jgi:hypothetical protein
MDGVMMAQGAGQFHDGVILLKDGRVVNPKMEYD